MLSPSSSPLLLSLVCVASWAQLLEPPPTFRPLEDVAGEASACVDALRGAPIVAVTSLNAPYAHDARERQWQGTLWETLAGGGGTAMPLVVYHENTMERAHGRKPLDAAVFPVVRAGLSSLAEKELDTHLRPWGAVVLVWRTLTTLLWTRPQATRCFIDVFDAVGGLARIVGKVRGTQMDNLHEVDGLRSQHPFMKEGKIAVRKVAAIAHLMRSVAPGTVILWLDADVIAPGLAPGNAMSPAALHWLRSRDVSYLALTACWSAAATADASLASPWQLPDVADSCTDDFEISGGVQAFTAGPRVQGFIMHTLLGYYGRLYRWVTSCLGGGAATKAPGGVASDLALCKDEVIMRSLGPSDALVMAIGLRFYGDHLTHGWLVAGDALHCQAAASSVSGMCSLCTPRSSSSAGLVAHFDLAAYFRHETHGMASLILRAHSARMFDKNHAPIPLEAKVDDAELRSTRPAPSEPVEGQTFCRVQAT